MALSISWRIALAGASYPGRIVDASHGGARFQADQAIGAKPGDTVVLTGDGLPHASMTVAAVRDKILHLAMAAGDEAGRRVMAAAFDSLAADRAA